MTVQDMLSGLASGLKVMRDGPALIVPGTPVAFHLVPPTLNLTVPTTTDGQVSFTFLAKSVRFAGALLPTGDLAVYLTDAAKVLGGQPIVDLSIPMQGPPLVGAVPDQTVVELAQAISVSGTPTAPTPDPVVAPLQTVTSAPGPVASPVVPPPTPSADDLASGVPGLLGRVVGTIPIPTLAPVQVTVTWQVRDAAQHQPIVPQPTMLGGEADVQFVFDAVFVEADRTKAVSTTDLEIVATVTLSAASVSVSIDLPAVPVIVPQVPVPTILVISNRVNFGRGIVGDDDNALMIAVPDCSPLATVADVTSALTALLTTLQNITSAAGAAAQAVSLLSGVQTLQAVLNAWSPTGDEFPLPMVRGDVIDPHEVGYGPTKPLNAAWPDNFDEEDKSVLLLGAYRAKGVHLGSERLFTVVNPQNQRVQVQDKLVIVLGASMWVAVPDLNNLQAIGTGVFPDPNVMIPALWQPSVTTLSGTNQFHDLLEIIAFVPVP